MTCSHVLVCQLYTGSDQQEIMLCSSTQQPIFEHPCQPVHSGLKHNLKSPDSSTFSYHSTSTTKPTTRCSTAESSISDKQSPRPASNKPAVRSLLSFSCCTATKLAGRQSWLCLLFLLSLAGGSWAQSGGSCPVSIEYAASLGQGGANADVPVFVGSLGITNNANVRSLHHQ